MERKETKIIHVILLALLFLAGCGKVSEETVRSVLERDPSFEKALDTKRRINGKIENLRGHFMKEEEGITAKIHNLREELDKKKETCLLKIESLQKELDPVILELRDRFDEAKAEYRLRKEDLRTSVTKLADINKLLKKKEDRSLSGDEISVWKRRAGKLEKEIMSLEGQLETLRDKVSLLQAEIRILKQ